MERRRVRIFVRSTMSWMAALERASDRGSDRRTPECQTSSLATDCKSVRDAAECKSVRVLLVPPMERSATHGGPLQDHEPANQARGRVRRLYATATNCHSRCDCKPVRSGRPVQIRARSPGASSERNGGVGLFSRRGRRPLRGQPPPSTPAPRRPRRRTAPGARAGDGARGTRSPPARPDAASRW